MLDVVPMMQQLSGVLSVCVAGAARRYIPVTVTPCVDCVLVVACIVPVSVTRLGVEVRVGVGAFALGTTAG